MTDRALALAWSTDLERTEAARAAAAAGGRLGDSCTWSAPFDLLRILDGTTVPADPVAWAQRIIDGDPVEDPAAALELRRRTERFYAAWQRAEADYAAGRRRSPAFAILELEVAPGRGRPARRRRRLTDEQRAKQRHRYKGAMADALEAFARPRLHTPSVAERARRPRWLDHRASCSSEGCRGCARIPLPPAPRWRRRRRRRDSITVAEWLMDRAAAARSCQDVVALRDASCGGVMVLPQSCHVRAEPDCESARQQRVVRTYRAAVEKLDPERARFLTLTKRNPPRDHLAGGILELQAAAEQLRRRAVWKGGRCRDRGSCSLTSSNSRHRRSCQREACAGWQPGTCRQPWDPDKPGWRLPHAPVAASMTTLEVTYNPKARSWHPHLHVLLESPYIDQDELAATWLALTGDSDIVWIESVQRQAAERHAGDLEATLRELLKYAAKPHPAFLDYDDPAVLAELLVALRGRHLMATAGKLYGLGLEDPDHDSPCSASCELCDAGQDPADHTCTMVVAEHVDGCRCQVTVWPPGELLERPFLAPRLCPLHAGVASWQVMGHRRRVECVAVPDPGRPGRRFYTWHESLLPAGASLEAITSSLPGADATTDTRAGA